MNPGSLLTRPWGLFRGYARETYERICWRLKLKGIEHRRPILVYQMGKVGSSTVVRTLRAVEAATPVLHVHTLTRTGLDHAVRRQRASRQPYLPEHLIVSEMGGCSERGRVLRRLLSAKHGGRLWHFHQVNIGLASCSAVSSDASPRPI
jgi:hypothetical protein